MTATTTMTYTELRARQQKEFDALPLGFAFTDEQYGRMMRAWGLDPDADADKIRSIGYGGYVRNTDAELLHRTLDRHGAEMDAAIAADKTGDGFIYQMFLSELDNHEYGYTLDPDDTLDALGYTAEDIQDDPRLLHGLRKAAVELRAA